MANTSGLKKTGGHERQRRFSGVAGRRPDQRERRVREAAERQAAYDLLTIEQKLERLERSCALHCGTAASQRARLTGGVDASAEHTNKKRRRRSKEKIDESI